MEKKKDLNDDLYEERKKIMEEIKQRKEINKKGFCEISICSECGNTALARDYVRAEVVCPECGIVLDENIIDHGPEWRVFDGIQQEQRARTGPPLSRRLHDRGLTSFIDSRGRDSSGAKLSFKDRAKFHRLRKWQRRSRIGSGRERGLALAFAELDRMISAGGLSADIAESAADIYRKAYNAKLVQGRSIESLISAVLYVACRQNKASRTLDEIAIISRASKKQIGRAVWMLQSELILKLSPSSPLEFLPRFCSPLKFPDFTIESRAIEVVKIAVNEGVHTGKSPEGVAAAAIYYAYRESGLNIEGITQDKLAVIAGSTAVTVRKIYKQLVKKLDVKLKKQAN